MVGVEPGKRGGSWQRDEVAVRRYIVPDLGARPIGSLTPGDVQAVVNKWSAARAPRTVRREYGVLQSILNYAIRLDMLGRSPCRGINLPKAAPVRRHVVDAAELARLAKALGGVDGYGPMVYLGAVTGLRWGEVAGLRVERVDTEAGTVAVVETIVRGRKGSVGIGLPKSEAGRRTLALPHVLVEMLTAHMAAVVLTEADGDALLFTAPGGGPLRYTNWLRRVWYPATIAAGLGKMVEDDATGRRRYDGLGFHDLRRASATGLVAAGVDVKTAQSVLGHTDARVTLDLYAQVVTAQPWRPPMPWRPGSSIRPRGINAGWRPRRRVETRPPKKTERACEQALSWVSGGGDLNSRPLRPERSALPN